MNASLSLDIHGKSDPFRELGLEIEVPDAMVGRLAEYRRDVWDFRGKPAAATPYIASTGDRLTSEADLINIIGDKDYAFTLTPQSVGGMFFPEAAANGGE